MANWAAFKERERGLPVHKRARYGIHFDKGNGEILAEFVGKPCHYQEGGIWKPIDTALLPTADGWYSSPHSDVIIHPDGRVRLKGSDYQQFTKLPSAKAGRLDGDKIIREFPGGEQHLIMKEDGFREEIHIFKPTLKIEKFIAKTTGKLPTKYKARPVTAEDAKGRVYEFTGNVKEFGAWLDKAVYPVVIDPDFSVTSGVAGDAGILQSAGYNNYNNGGGVILPLRCQTGADWRCLFRFDLSSVDASNICNSAILKLISRDTEPSDTYSIYEISGANGDWVEGTKWIAIESGSCCWNYKAYSATTPIAWAGSAGLSTPGVDYVDTIVSSKTASIDIANSEFDLEFNSSGLLMVKNWFGQTTNSGFILRKSNSHEADFHSGEATTAEYRPVLTVLYSSGGVPKHFMYYQRLRSL